MILCARDCHRCCSPSNGDMKPAATFDVVDSLVDAETGDEACGAADRSTAAMGAAAGVAKPLLRLVCLSTARDAALFSAAEAPPEDADRCCAFDAARTFRDGVNGETE